MPDECYSVADLRLVASSLVCVDLEVTNVVPIRGGEIGLAYDSSVVAGVTVTSGPDLPQGATIYTERELTSCPPDPEVDKGFSVAWLNSETDDDLTDPGTCRLLTICLDPQPGVAPDSCTPLKFVSCLGDPDAPVRNMVTSAAAESRQVSPIEGELCPATQ